MTRPTRHTRYPLQYQTIIRSVFNLGKTAKVVCPSMTEATTIRNGFYGWRERLREYVERGKFIDTEDEKNVKEQKLIADRIIIKLDTKTTTIRFALRDDQADARLMDRAEFEDV